MSDPEKREPRKYYRAPRLEPHDIDFLELILKCEVAIQSGWGNWYISKCAGKTFVKTESLGLRQIPIDFGSIEKELHNFEENLKNRGIAPTTLTGTKEIEEWLNKSFPK